MKIKNIVIIGGGTAGWSTAHQFLNKTDNTNITVIASKEKPIIGVGESTTGRFVDLIRLKNNLGNINEEDFLHKTGSTFKLGIKHSDWYKKGEFFWSPIGDDFHNDTFYPCYDYDFYRIFHVAEKLQYHNTFQSKLMANNKLHLVDNLDVTQTKYNQATAVQVAYHLDTYKVGQYLKEKAINTKKVKHIEDEIVDVTKDKKGFVKSVKTKTGKVIKGDLFVDCSGFYRLLIEKEFDNKFVSYEDNLLVNRAMPFYVENEGDKPIRNYTHAWAQKHGWLWEIPTQERLGCGYVYSDNHTTPDKAQEEIEKVLGHKIQPLNDIKFKTGRLEKFWHKNVISSGLSSAFIEPLEATSIHCTILQITHFIENYWKNELPIESDLFEKQYNAEMTNMWDEIRDFIVYHYITPRKDTDFWKESSHKDRRTDNLNIKLEKWKYRMPRYIDIISPKFNNFYSLGNVLWYQIALGMRILDPKIAKKELQDYGLYDHASKIHSAISNNVEQALPNMIDSNKYFNHLTNLYGVR